MVLDLLEQWNPKPESRWLISRILKNGTQDLPSLPQAPTSWVAASLSLKQSVPKSLSPGELPFLSPPSTAANSPGGFPGGRGSDCLAFPKQVVTEPRGVMDTGQGKGEGEVGPSG